jgi:hypothetical protein
MSTSPVTLKDEKPSRQDVLAFLEDLWQKLDAQIRQSESNLRRLIEQKVRVEDRIVSLQEQGSI